MQRRFAQCLLLFICIPGAAAGLNGKTIGLVCLCVQGSSSSAVAQQRNKSLLSTRISSQSNHPVAARLAAQNALFKEQYEDDMRASPETATARGDYRYNAMLDDRSVTASARQNAADRSYRAKLTAISTHGFAEQDRLSHDLLLDVLDNRIADFELKNYEMPLSQIDAFTWRWLISPMPCRSIAANITKITLPVSAKI